LRKDIVPKILKTDSDWSFILKLDALLESVANDIIRHGLQIQLLKQTFRNDPRSASAGRQIGIFGMPRVARRGRSVPIKRKTTQRESVGQLIVPTPSSDELPSQTHLNLVPVRGTLGTILAHSWHKFGTIDFELP